MTQVCICIRKTTYAISDRSSLTRVCMSEMFVRGVRWSIFSLFSPAPCTLNPKIFYILLEPSWWVLKNWLKRLRKSITWPKKNFYQSFSCVAMQRRRISSALFKSQFPCKPQYAWQCWNCHTPAIIWHRSLLCSGLHGDTEHLCVRCSARQLLRGEWQNCPSSS